MTGPDIHRQVLDNPERRMLVVGTGGRIRALNPAAERILGRGVGEAEGRNFAELFIVRESWRAVPVRSPIEGEVAAVHFGIAPEVPQGRVLLELDLTRTRQKYAAARKNQARALQRVEALEDARLKLKAARTELQGNRRVVGDDDHRDPLLAVEADQELRHGAVRVPITGLASLRGGGEFSAGTSVRSGQDLLNIGDFSRIMASVEVDETEAVRLQAGQKVTATSNAFRGLQLRGEVTPVSSQADSRSRGIPKFDVTVTLERAGPEAAARLRSGMSGRPGIVTFNNSKAHSVPLAAIESYGGTHGLRVVNPATGEIEERQVEIGPTTRTSVQIRRGLKTGETILARGG